MRSLADDLRARADEQLVTLVTARPDLLHPVPADIAALARHAGSPGSVAACLRGYDQLTLHVVLAAALTADPIRPAAFARDVATRIRAAAAVGAPDSSGRGGPAGLPAAGALTTRVRDVVGILRAHALLWGDRSLHLVVPARDLMVPADRGPRVAALDPVVAGYAQDPATLTGLLDTAPPGVGAALERLLAGPVIGAVSDAARTADPARSPVDWMLAHHLLVPVGTDRAAVPAEVVAILRGAGTDDPARHVIGLVPPRPDRPAPDPARVDPGAVGTMLDCLHRTSDLARAWAADPPTRLRTGGIGARDVSRTARMLGATPEVTALLVEVAWAAGLLGTDPMDQVSVLPTAAFDAWADRPPAEQHAALLVAWRDMPREVGDTERRPLTPELAGPGLPDLRRDVLRVLAGAGDDDPVGGWTDEEVVAALDWWAPRRHDATRADRVRAILEQARVLGITVGGTLTSAGRALAAPIPAGPVPRGSDQGGPGPAAATAALDADADAAVVGALAGILPGQVDTLILQADLTAIVPGLPAPALAELLREMADPESVGAASTFRFSAASIRRALDCGRTAAELHAELSRRAAVPQPLAYLIDDVARRHAVLRIGSAQTFVRCEDPVVLAGILADPRAAELGLVALSDTVLASPQPPEHVHEGLRQLGHSPLPEAREGAPAPRPRRARGRPTDGPVADAPITPALAAAAVRAIRSNDAAPTVPATTAPAVHPIPTMSPAEIAEVLRAAIAAESEVWIGYADPSGVAGDRRVEPLRLAGGYLTALDARSQTITSFALARITGAQRS